MTSVLELLLKIGKGTIPPEQGAATMSIIVQRPYAHLEKELCRAFETQEDVNVFVDRRYGARRASQQPITIDRRRADRRRSKSKLIEVLLSV